MSIKKMISIWFFVGGLLTAYGVLILIAGLMGSGGGREVVMQGLHLQIWWGIGMLILGVVYLVRFRPGRAGN
ncbi:MAG TPA: hypothetical protein VH088_16130 [Terriglobales bacterium]|jgi:hypothetical protein|nr:hypothetical protein [Terriglobales bacterium]